MSIKGSKLKEIVEIKGKNLKYMEISRNTLK
jgi:hypothetical protein